MSIRSKTGSQDWFYHAPSPHKKTSGEVVIPAPSQIPGLSQLDEPMSDESEKFQRKWIRDDDTEYVKLAKAGGRKDIFRYKEHLPSENGAAPYPRADWFDHDEVVSTPENNNNNASFEAPEWYGHEEHIKSQDSPNMKRRPILGFDEKTVWERDTDDVKLPTLKNKKNKLLGRKCKSQGYNAEELVTFPKIQPRGGLKKTIDNGDMSDLLSFTYQKDFLKEAKERTQEMKRKKQELQRERVEKVARDQDKYARQKKPQIKKEEKPLFKMKKTPNSSK